MAILKIEKKEINFTDQPTVFLCCFARRPIN